MDLKLALRSLRKSRGTSLTIMAILAFGIGGTTAIFSVFNGLFLRPLPFPEPSRLVDVDETAPRWELDFVSVSYPDFEAWRERNVSFEALAAYDDQDMNLFLGGESRRVRAARVTHDMTRVLGIEPTLGRGFTPEEDRPGGERVALVGDAFWREQFGGEQDVLGTSLLLDGQPYSVIGVLPPEAIFVEDAELWLPLATDAAANPGSWYLNAMGRLKPDATPESARTDLHRIHKAMIESRSMNEITSPVVTPIPERLFGEYRSGTTALLVAVGFVLLMVCANVSGLMLARSASRRREMGIRLALGAPRSRIVLQVLTESLLLALAGGTLGVAIGHGALRSLLSGIPEEVPRFLRFEMDGRFLLVSLVAVLGSAGLSGLAPALRASRTDAFRALRESGRHFSESAAARFRMRALVVLDLAMALVLLVGAGVLLQSYLELHRVDPGFRPEGVLTYRLSLPPSTYEDDEKLIRFYERHLEEMRFPGVLAAGAVSTAPLGSHEGWFFEAEGAPPREPDAPTPVVLNRVATPGYFDAISITLASGRFFDDNDGREDAPKVAVVNGTFARTFWPGQGAVGKRIRAGGDDEPWLTVVGVAQDVKHYGLATEMRPGVYLPFRASTRRSMTVALRTSLPPETLARPVRESVRRIDPAIPVYDLVTLSEKLERSLWTRRASSWLVSIFAGFALVLAVAGIYGVISFAVSQRTREIAIRMALGARRSQVLGNVLAQGGILIGMGIGLGVVGALGSGRILSAFAFQVSATEPGVYGAVIGILAASGLLANWFPARRASAVDPMEFLRAE